MFASTRAYENWLTMFHNGNIDGYELQSIFNKLNLNPPTRKIKAYLEKLGNKSFFVKPALDARLGDTVIYRNREAVPGYIELENLESKTFRFRFEECFSFMDFGSILVSKTFQELAVKEGDEATMSADPFCLVINVSERQTKSLEEIIEEKLTVTPLITGGYVFEGVGTICAASEKVKQMLCNPKLDYYLYV